MSEIHDSEDAVEERTPSPQALAEELSIECPVCQAPVGSWCQKKIGFDTFDGLHAKRCDDFVIMAHEKILSSEWSFLKACDHGSHMYCYPCMNCRWTPEMAKTKCAACGGALDKSSGEIPGAYTSIVTDDDGNSWHVEHAPKSVLIGVEACTKACTGCGWYNCVCA